jgi:hypothetical protein
MVTIILAARGECALVRDVGSSIEHPGIFAVPGHALPFQIGHVLGQGRRAEAAALVTHDTRLRHDAPGVRAEPD